MRDCWLRHGARFGRSPLLNLKASEKLHERSQVEGLREEAEPARISADVRELVVAVADETRQEREGDFFSAGQGAEIAKELDSVPVRHSHVADDEAGHLLLHAVERFGAVLSGLDTKPLGFEQRSQRIGE